MNRDKPLMTAAKRNIPKGFTLIELVMTIVILGTLSLILIPFFQSIARSPDPVIRQRGIALGQALMDEILSKKWDHNTPVGGGPICTGKSLLVRVQAVNIEADCGEAVWQATVPGSLGPETGEGRTTYDDVDDYHNLSEENDFADQNEDPFTMVGYSREAEVCYIDSNQAVIDHETSCVTGATFSDATDTKLIVVTVTTPTGETLRFVSAVCNL